MVIRPLNEVFEISSSDSGSPVDSKVSEPSPGSLPDVFRTVRTYESLDAEYVSFATEEAVIKVEPAATSVIAPLALTITLQMLLEYLLNHALSNHYILAIF